MTSLAETYLSCKTAMANKLNAKGITDASADDGLTTLINYIDDIAPGVNGLLLSADKSIGQSSDTVNFTALYVADGNVVSGKSVNFYGLKSATSTSKSLTANTWTPVGCKYSITVPSSGEGSLQLTKYNSSSQSVYIVWAAGIIIVSGAGATYRGVSNIVFEDGILSFTYNGSTVTEDISSFDCTEVKAEDSGVTIDDYGVFDTTDANGVATATYTCSGAGKFDVQAISGSVVSQPYTVIDATIYDKGLSGTGEHTDIWYAQSNGSLERTSEYTELTEGSGSSAMIYRPTSSYQLPKTNICIELDFYKVDGANSNICLGFENTGMGTNKTYSLDNLGLTTGAWHHIKFVVDSDGYVTPNELTAQKKLLDFNTEKMYFMFLGNGDTTKLRFKNFVVYPI